MTYSRVTFEILTTFYKTGYYSLQPQTINLSTNIYYNTIGRFRVFNDAMLLF